MDKKTLIRYINNQASVEECEQVMHWSQSRLENMQYLMSLINLHAALPVGDRLSEEQFRDFERKHACKKNALRRFFGKRAVRMGLGYAAAAVLILSLVINIRQWQEGKAENSIQSLILLSSTAENRIQEIYVAKGEKSRIELPDGSIVWLNSDSKISFPQAFSASARCVSFSGEAYFDVVKNPAQPMIVTIDDKYSLKVLGTEFNVKSYRNSGTLETTLYSGSVNIYQKNDSNEYVPVHEMKPSESYIINMTETIPATVIKRNMTRVKMDDVLCWKKGILNFESTPLKSAFNDIERWYDIRIDIQDLELLKGSISGRFEELPVENVLQRIGDDYSIDFTKDGDRFIARKRK